MKADLSAERVGHSDGAVVSRDEAAGLDQWDLLPPADARMVCDGLVKSIGRPPPLKTCP